MKKQRAHLAPLAAACLLALLALPTTAAADPGNPPRFGFDGFLLGAFIDGRWVSHEDLQESERYRPYRIWGGNDCRVYRFSGLEHDMAVATADPRDHQDDEPDGKYTGPDTHTMPVQIESGAGLGLGDARLTVIGDFDAMPRKAQILPPDNATYKKVVAEHLASRGLARVEPKIVQLLRVDLDGDGADEVLIAAQNIVYPDDGAQAELFSFAPDEPLMRELHNPNGVDRQARTGQYSLVLLRRVIGGQAKNIRVAEFVAAKGGRDIPRVHKIAAIADLNGDGTMEIVLAEASFNALRYQVYEARGSAAPRMVLENGMTGD